MTDELLDEIEALYGEKGSEPYGEQVTMLEHSLLTAATARGAGASDAMVVAAFLHDIGHLLVPPDDEFGKHTHDAIGGDWLAERFPPEVSEPVRLHVDAKRYLCGIDPAYYDDLSPASQYTLGQQGGPMTPEQCAEFALRPFSKEAVELRRWEDAFGKVTGVEPATMTELRPMIADVAAS